MAATPLPLWIRAVLLSLAALGAQSASAQTASRCTETRYIVSTQCPYQELKISDGVANRSVRYALPVGTAPATGWKVAMLFHGTGGLISWQGVPGSNGGPFGYYYQVQLLKSLLDSGYAVIAPPSSDVASGWDTNESALCPKSRCGENVGPTVEQYRSTRDYALFTALFATIDRSAVGSGFGVKLDSGHLYAAGISGGGYNTSRMAINFPGRFRALAIQSASYASCSGFYCPTLPVPAASHPPTLFLHGAGDRLVPVTSMFPYSAKLAAQGKSYDVVDYTPGLKLVGDTRCTRESQANCAIAHQWISAAPVEILNWFQSHP